MSSSIYNSHESFKKYQLKEAESTYLYIPPCKSIVESQKPLTIREPTNIMCFSSIDMQWIPYSRRSAVAYLLLSIISLSYYLASFIYQYANGNGIKYLDEAYLTRVVMVQWLVVAIVLLSGIVGYRKLFMPLYIILSVNATNGVVVLFVLKIKQLMDAKIDLLDIPLNLLGVLLFCALIHNAIYCYAIYIQNCVRQLQKQREFCQNVSGYYSTIHSSYFQTPINNKFRHIYDV